MTVRRYIPKDEARERLHKIKKKLKHERKKNKKERKHDSDDSETDDEDNDRKSSKKKQKNKKKEKDRSKERKGHKKENGDIFTVSSASEGCSESEEDGDDSKGRIGSRRPSSAMRRPGSALRRDYRGDDSSDRESLVIRRAGSKQGRDKDSNERDKHKKDRRSRDKYGNRKNHDSDDSSDESERSKSPVFNRSARKFSTSASSLKRQASESRKGKSKKEDYDDDELEELKVPLYEECFFECNKWLATDEDDGLFVRELTVTSKQTFYKENPMQ